MDLKKNKKNFSLFYLPANYLKIKGIRYTIFMSKIEQLEVFLKSNPKDPLLRHALALEKIKAGQDADARVIFESLLQDQPGYVGSYYHLAKLLERQGESTLAVNWYTKGMEIAKTANDQHAFKELQMAYEDLIDN